MPFTPFHMGAALIVKPVLNRNFSVITFGIAQVAMDIEPGIGMLTGSGVLHGPTHSILGSLVIACLVMLIAPSICGYLRTKWNMEVIHYKLPWLVQSESVPKIAVIIGAFFGTLSHVALDSLMHRDIQLLLPFSKANPLMGLITHDGVYELCAIASFLGVAAWLAMKLIGYSPQVVGVSEANEPLVTGVPQGFWVLWVTEMRFTWIWIFFLTIIPSVLYGKAIFSMMVLMAAVLIGFPYIVVGQLVTKGSWGKNLRRLVVMVLVPIMSMVYLFQVDQKIPANATPITKAIESFQFETGHYPVSLKMLTPKYLTTTPDVRFSLIQPPVTYRVTDGKAYLAIPSAEGDPFAKYEYDFETRTWKHYN